MLLTGEPYKMSGILQISREMLEEILVHGNDEITAAVRGKVSGFEKPVMILDEAEGLIVFIEREDL